MPHHMKDLCLRQELTTSGEDYHGGDMLSDCDSETPMLYAMQSDGLPPESESTESNNDKGDDDTGNAQDLYRHGSIATGRVHSTSTKKCSLKAFALPLSSV